eukprot:3829119-Prymnesium_polylepis.1
MADGRWWRPGTGIGRYARPAVPLAPDPRNTPLTGAAYKRDQCLAGLPPNRVLTLATRTHRSG